MSEFLERIRALISAGEVRVSDHRYDELAGDPLTAREVVDGVREAVVVEEYPNYPKGRASCSCKRIEQESPFMLYGLSREVMTNLSSWSLLTGRTLTGGTKVS